MSGHTDGVGYGLLTGPDDPKKKRGIPKGLLAQQMLRTGQGAAPDATSSLLASGLRPEMTDAERLAERRRTALRTRNPYTGAESHPPQRTWTRDTSEDKRGRLLAELGAGKLDRSQMAPFFAELAMSMPVIDEIRDGVNIVRSAIKGDAEGVALNSAYLAAPGLLGLAVRGGKRMLKASEHVDRFPGVLANATFKKDGTLKSVANLDFRGVPLHEAEDAAVAGIHLVPKKGGGYVGFPEGVTDEAKMLDEVYEQAKAGSHINPKTGAPYKNADGTDQADARDWYDHMRAQNEKVTSATPMETDPGFAQTTALTSQQANPKTNLNLALRGNAAAVVGAPIPNVKTPKQAQRLQEAFDTGDDIPLGPKTGIYADHMDPYVPKPQTGTNDVISGRVFGYPLAYTSKTWAPSLTEHAVMDAGWLQVTKRMNDEGTDGLQWAAGQVQARTWVDKKARTLMKQRGLSYEAAREEAVKGYPEFFDEFTAHTTSELVPSPAGGSFPGLKDSEEARNLFGVSWRDASGRDVALDAAGLYGRETKAGTGMYEGVTSPMEVGKPLVDMESGGMAVGEHSAKALDQVQIARGLLDNQQSSAWHHVGDVKKVGDRNGVFIKNSGAATPDQMREIEQLTKDKGFWIADTGEGVTIGPLGYEPSASGKELQELIAGEFGDDLARIMGSPAQAKRVHGSYIPIEPDNYVPGKGMSTAHAIERLEETPELMKRLENASMRRKAAEKLTHNEEVATGLLGDVGQADEGWNNLLRMYSTGGWAKVKRGLKNGSVLPATLLAIVGKDVAEGLLAQ